MRNYEIMYIIRTTIAEDEIKKVAKSFEKVLTDNGAKIVDATGKLYEQKYSLWHYKNEINKLILWSAAGSICEHIRRSFDNGIKLENGHSLIGPSFELSQAMVDSTYHYDTFKGIEKYTNPVLLIHGRNDLAVDYLTSMKYSVTYPNALVHIVDGAGHGYDKLNEMNDLYNRSLDFLIKDYKID